VVVDETDIDWFASALDEVVGEARRLPAAALRFAARAAGVPLHGRLRRAA
jgi:hypothetical protein